MARPAYAASGALALGLIFLVPSVLPASATDDPATTETAEDGTTPREPIVGDPVEVPEEFALVGTVAAVPPDGTTVDAESSAQVEAELGVYCPDHQAASDGDYLCWSREAPAEVTSGGQLIHATPTPLPTRTPRPTASGTPTPSPSDTPPVGQTEAPTPDASETPVPDVSPVAEETYAPDLAGEFAASGLTPVTPPSSCSYATGSDRLLSRTWSCHRLNVTGVHIEVRNGSARRLGTGLIDMLSYEYMQVNMSSVILQTRVKLVSTTGDFSPTISGTYMCTGRCDGKRGTFSSRQFTKGKDFYAVGGVTPEIGYGAIGTLTHNWTFRIEIPGAKGNPTATASSLKARCDYAGASGVSGRGCVVAQYLPTLQYSKSGKYPAVAAHISAALKSGLRGGSASSPLTRTTNTTIFAANRRVSCPTTLTRPTGMQCDEYPFASTLEGGASGGSPRVFQNCSLPVQPGSGSVGFSRCMVPATQNSGAGGTLGAFYSAQRVLDGDKFIVKIVP